MGRQQLIYAILKLENCMKLRKIRKIVRNKILRCIFGIMYILEYKLVANNDNVIYESCHYESNKKM